MMSGTNKQDKGQTGGGGMALLKEEAYSNDKLPEEILGLVFRKIEHLESQLSCRLICKYWKTAFDNSRNMRQITFRVNDWRLFNESTIVDKVKSITCTAPFLVTGEESKNEWLQFCNRIGSSVEKIKFDFYYVDNDTQQTQLINSLVSSCVRLKELDIKQQVLECLQEPKYEKIQVLVLTSSGRQDGALELALTHFPNLVKIQIHHLWVPGAMRILLEYAKASQGLLKEITIQEPVGEEAEAVNIEELFKFLHTCNNLGLKSSDNFLPFHVDAKVLFDYEETTEAPVNEVTCRSIQSSWLNFDGINPLATDRIGYCRNIGHLLLMFSRPALLGELLFFPKLQKLKCLHFCVGPEFLNNTIVNQVNFAGVVLQFGFPTLGHLNITRDVFGQAINEVLPSFGICFPNLKRLCLKSLKIVPTDIFVHLSKLEFLEEIHIHGFRVECQWTDDKFTFPCESQRQNQGGVLVPAIAAFKNLGKLTIKNCCNVTDLFIVQGIALSKTLSVLKIFNCRRTTEASSAALQGSAINYTRLP